MRLSELRGLNWRNVDLDNGVIRVRQRADAWGHIGPPKSKAGKRDIHLRRLSSTPSRSGALIVLRGNSIFFSGMAAGISNGCRIFTSFSGSAANQTRADSRHRQKGYGRRPDPRPPLRLPDAAARRCLLFIRYLGCTPKRLQSVVGAFIDQHDL